MAAPRLPFLWPMLYRSAERAALESRPVTRRQAIHTSVRRRQQAAQHRYGSANEPPPRLETNAKARSSNKSAATATKKAAPPKSNEPKAKPTQSTTLEETSQDGAAAESTNNGLTDPPEIPPPTPLSAAIGSSTQNDKPVDTLLDSIPDLGPAASKDNGSGPPRHTDDNQEPPFHAPHMETPRYVHNFDTFGLVKRLEDSGWKDEQAVTVMKSMRLMLADNMNLARDALVSKSQVENESYLFKAACSELRMEVLTRRRGEQEKMRTQRAQLQHEVEISNQRFSQDSATLKDELKGMFDDRKMSVRNEQREMERKVAELNYKITVSLQADSRSDIEGLRWIMTRRVIITLLVIVIMVLGSLKLYSNALHEKETEQKRRAAMRSVGTQSDDGVASDAGMGKGSQTIEGHIVVNGGDNPAYVSLG